MRTLSPLASGLVCTIAWALAVTSVYFHIIWLTNIGIDWGKHYSTIFQCSRSENGRTEGLLALMAELRTAKEDHSLRLQLLATHMLFVYHAFPMFHFWASGVGTTMVMGIGAIFGIRRGLVLCPLMASLGPGFAYWLIRLTGTPLIDKLPFIRKKIIKLADLLNINELSEFGILVAVIVSRITPMLPNVAVTVGAPILKTPFRPYLLGTYIGLFPKILALLWLGSVLKVGVSWTTSVQLVSTMRQVSLRHWGSLTPLVVTSVALIVAFSFFLFYRMRRNSKKTGDYKQRDIQSRVSCDPALIGTKPHVDALN